MNCDLNVKYVLYLKKKTKGKTGGGARARSGIPKLVLVEKENHPAPSYLSEEAVPNKCILGSYCHLGR